VACAENQHKARALAVPSSFTLLRAQQSSLYTVSWTWASARWSEQENSQQGAQGHKLQFSARWRLPEDSQCSARGPQPYLHPVPSAGMGTPGAITQTSSSHTSKTDSGWTKTLGFTHH